jgi:hypothetical protein
MAAAIDMIRISELCVDPDGCVLIIYSEQQEYEPREKPDMKVTRSKDMTKIKAVFVRNICGFLALSSFFEQQCPKVHAKLVKMFSERTAKLKHATAKELMVEALEAMVSKKIYSITNKSKRA